MIFFIVLTDSLSGLLTSEWEDESDHKAEDWYDFVWVTLQQFLSNSWLTFRAIKTYIWAVAQPSVLLYDYLALH